jgi:signal peptidase I
VTDDHSSVPAPEVEGGAPAERWGATGARGRRRRARIRRWRTLRAAWEWAKSVQLAVLLFLLARALLVEAFRIPSGSMEGTLLVGDFLLVNKLLYGAELPVVRAKLPAVRAPRYGDVLVFRFPPDPSKDFVKRLVGLPGDTVAMRHGVLLRNGRPQRERYAVHRPDGFDGMAAEFLWQRAYLAPGVDAPRYRPSRDTWGPLVVPARHFFVLGDNRDNSLDSRYWGFVPDTLVRGSPMFVYFSMTPDSLRERSWTDRVRWARLGAMIR